MLTWILHSATVLLRTVLNASKLIITQNACTNVEVVLIATAEHTLTIAKD